MMTLHEYIVEAANSTAKFDHACSSIDDLFAAKPEFFSILGEDITRNILNDITSNYSGIDIDHKYIYTTGNKNYIKIPYIFNEAVINTFNKQVYRDLGIIYSRTGNLKIKVYKKIGQKAEIELLETGEGSLKTVNTRDQEVATCQIWNSFSTLGIDSKIYTKEDINSIMKDNMESSVDFDKAWAQSITKQIYAIKNYLNNIGITDISRYKAERYGGDSKVSNWIVSKYYKLFISSYTKAVEGQKDNYDPTDIILFDTDYSEQIINTLKNLSQYKDVFEAKKVFTNTFYTDQTSELKDKLIGISLKKIGNNSSGRFDVFNTGETNSIDVSSFTLHNNFDMNGKIICHGKFNILNIDTSDIDGKINRDINNSYLVLCYRSFGGSQTAIDIKLSNETGKDIGPSLGKIPVSDWTKYLTNGVKPGDIPQGRAIIKKYIETQVNTSPQTNKKIINILNIMIQDGLKIGPNCFPYVLIH